MRRLVVSMGLTAVLGLTGCGGGSDDDAAAPTTTSPPSTAVAPATNDQAGTPFCKLAKTFIDKVPNLTTANGPALKAATTDAESAIRQAKDTAPAEIKSDVTVVATAATQALAGLQRSNFDRNKTPEIAVLNDQGFRDSLFKVLAYAQAHCGVG